jgi:predicted small secreted protein
VRYLLILLVAFSLVACEDRNADGVATPAEAVEQAGDGIAAGAREVGEGIQEGAEEVGDAVEAAGEEIRDGD